MSANTYEFKSDTPFRLALSLSLKLETTVKIKGCAYDRLMYRVMVMVAIQYVHSRGRVDYARFIYVLCALMFCIPHWCFSYMLCGASLTVKFGCSMLCSCFHEGSCCCVLSLSMMIMFMMALYAYCLANFNPSRIYKFILWAHKIIC